MRFVLKSAVGQVGLAPWRLINFSLTTENADAMPYVPEELMGSRIVAKSAYTAERENVLMHFGHFQMAKTDLL
jgi:hypothetical protein